LHQLILKNLNKNYNGRRIVNSVDMTLQSGQVVGLLGPNGAGKTTTFYMTIGMIRPDEGFVFFDETDITGDPM